MSSKDQLRLVMMSGDWIPLQLPSRIKEKFHESKIISLGGATEASIWSIYYPINEVDKEWKSIPYGKPMKNQKFYILNNRMEFCPVGVKGELYIGGVGIANGYLNDSEKTNKAFIHHKTLGYIYKTGDYGVLHKEGYIEFLGRIDQQVKINGYRIELGEIESILMKYNGVNNAVVIAHSDENNRKSLCAYIESEEELETSELTAILSDKLPPYMIPSDYIILERFPLTSNGKIDRKRLPKPERNKANNIKEFVPKTDIQKKLYALWRKILNIDGFGIDDNFFQLGGDSIGATRLVTGIRKAFGIDIALNFIFRNGTIEGIENYISELCDSNENDDSDNVILLKKGSSSDKNLFFVHAGSGGIEVYVELCNRLTQDFNFWGIQQDKMHGIGPEKIEIESLAKKYTNELIKIQPKGPYYLAGWCVGGTIAFEMTRILEELGEKVELLGMINSLAPQKGLIEGAGDFSYDSELTIFKTYFDIKGFVEKINKLPNTYFDNVNDIWEYFIKHLESNEIGEKEFREYVPGELSRLIPNFNNLNVKELVYYINLFRSSQNSRAIYIPKQNVKANICFFEATEEKVANKERWYIYSDSLIYKYDVQGNHVTIYSSENIDKNSEIIDKAFNKMLGRL